MIIVIDTNVLLVSVSRKSNHNWLYNSLLQNKFDFAITADILHEYEEQLSIHWNSSVAEKVVNSLTERPNAIYTSIFYKLNIITDDPDDNKFIDCAFAANASYIVTDDKHFNILKKINFPKIQPVSVEEFKQIIK